MIRRTHLLVALALAFALFGGGRAGAHPHVIVEASASLDFNADFRVETVTVRYTLDDMTTSVLVEGLDADGNGIFERDELKALAQENAEALAEFDYFLEVDAAGQRVPVTGAVDYDYAYEGERLVLILTLKLERAIEPAAELVSLLLYDPTFYVLVELAEESPLFISGIEPEFCTARIEPPAQDSEGVSISDSMLETLEPTANIGREYADRITLSCGTGRG